MQSCFFGNIHEWINNTEKLCNELEKNMLDNKLAKQKNSARILLTGAPVIMPNYKIPNIIEGFDAIITIDETCAGSQYIYDPVEVDEWTNKEMMSAISESYLMPSVCPCFIKSEDRIDKLMNMIKEFKIDGVIYHTLRLCLLFDVESFKIKEIMEQNNIPFLQVNTDYSKEDYEQLRTRIEAFIEIIHHRR
jgi:benzoyl-CoA reductase/2-hydroxyglutaryl-CoA dehydratase subunit BcrC/BadD/HgdB